MKHDYVVQCNSCKQQYDEARPVDQMAPAQCGTCGSYDVDVWKRIRTNGVEEK
jgi:Oxygen-sensitive ribonucleoside-triphosphate reductase